MNFNEKQAEHIVAAIKELAMVGIEALAKAIIPVETENKESEENEKHDDEKSKQDNEDNTKV